MLHRDRGPVAARGKAAADPVERWWRTTCQEAVFGYFPSGPRLAGEVRAGGNAALSACGTDRVELGHPSLTSTAIRRPRHSSPASPGRTPAGGRYGSCLSRATKGTRISRRSCDVYVWLYDLDAAYEDGWGYSNGPLRSHPPARSRGSDDSVNGRNARSAPFRSRRSNSSASPSANAGWVAGNVLRPGLNPGRTGGCQRARLRRLGRQPGSAHRLPRAWTPAPQKQPAQRPQAVSTAVRGAERDPRCASEAKRRPSRRRCPGAPASAATLGLGPVQSAATRAIPSPARGIP